MVEHWHARKRAFATSVWASFLSACLATMLFFALFDPQQLLAASPELRSFTQNIQAIYSIGFFFFWVICAVAAGTCAWLVTTSRRIAEYPTE